MDKYLILLGIVALTALSFAGDGGPQNWMQSVQGRYSCMYDYNYEMLGLIGPGCEIIGEDEYMRLLRTYFECDDCMYWDTYLMYMVGGCRLDGDGDEVEALVVDGPDPATIFRYGMAAFNSDSAAFRAIFLASIRECLANPDECDCDSGEIYGGLFEIRSNYLSCIGDQPYCRPPKHDPEAD